MLQLTNKVFDSNETSLHLDFSHEQGTMNNMEPINSFFCQQSHCASRQATFFFFFLDTISTIFVSLSQMSFRLSCSDIHVSLQMNYKKFGDPLIFHFMSQISILDIKNYFLLEKMGTYCIQNHVLISEMETLILIIDNL